MAFSTFAVLCNCQDYLVLEHFITLNRNAVTSPYPFPPVPLLSISVACPFLIFHINWIIQYVILCVWLAIPLLGIYPKELKTTVQTKTWMWMFTAIPLTIADGGQIQMSINCWMEKQNVVYTRNGVLLNHKKRMKYWLCHNMDETQKHAEMHLIETSHKRQWFHL